MLDERSTGERILGYPTFRGDNQMLPALDFEAHHIARIFDAIVSEVEAEKAIPPETAERIVRLASMGRDKSDRFGEDLDPFGIMRPPVKPTVRGEEGNVVRFRRR
jgi:hypothetical protein